MRSRAVIKKPCAPPGSQINPSPPRNLRPKPTRVPPKRTPRTMNRSGASITSARIRCQPRTASHASTTSSRLSHSLA
eukprot:3051151-Prymnesium_polylepis.1